MSDEAEHLGALAYSRLLEKRYRQAVDLIEQSLALQADQPAWVFHDAAQAWAGLGHRQTAIEYLHVAADHGWSAIDATSPIT